MAKNRPKMGASAPSFRDTPSKNFLGFFQPIWVGEKNWPFFRQTNQKNRKTPSGRFFEVTVFSLCFFFGFWSQKSKKTAFLDFLFWTPSGFLSVLGGFWGLK